MGLIVDIYRNDYDGARCVFRGKKSITVINIEGPFEPDEDRPAAVLTKNALGDPIIKPASEPEGGPLMAGGTYAASSDSRFGQATGFYGAVAIHDWFETWAEYGLFFGVEGR